MISGTITQFGIKNLQLYIVRTFNINEVWDVDSDSIWKRDYIKFTVKFYIELAD